MTRQPDGKLSIRRCKPENFVLPYPNVCVCVCVRVVWSYLDLSFSSGNTSVAEGKLSSTFLSSRVSHRLASPGCCSSKIARRPCGGHARLVNSMHNRGIGEAGIDWRG